MNQNNFKPTTDILRNLTLPINTRETFGYPQKIQQARISTSYLSLVAPQH